MKFGQLVAVGFVVAGLIVVGSATASRADSSGITLNSQGTFKDLGLWLYGGPSGYRYGDATAGTNETIVLPSPDPKPGENVAGVMRLRHTTDLQGYPLQVSLVEKLFASTNHLTVTDSNDKNIRSWTPSSDYGQEHVIGGDGPPRMIVTGPMLANGPIPASYQAAFAYAKGVFASITNLPADQKDLSHYVVLFVETDHGFWMEFGPTFGANEAPHLGCQTQMGRDMVIGFDQYSKRSGPFIQCF